MMKTNRKEKNPKQLRPPELPGSKLHVEKAPGHEEVKLNPHLGWTPKRVIGTAVLRIPQDQRKNESRRHEKQEIKENAKEKQLI